MAGQRARARQFAAAGKTATEDRFTQTLVQPGLQLVPAARSPNGSDITQEGGSATSVDPGAKRVAYLDVSGKGQTITYDRLIRASGRQVARR